MKRLIVLFWVFVALGLTTANAQITITAADVGSTGDQVEYNFDSTNKVVNLGPSGANATWNYNFIANYDTALKYITPSTGQFASQFPTANLCLEASGFVGYFNKSNTILESLGGAGTIGSLTTYLKWNPPLTQVQFPSTFNSSFTDQGSWEVKGKLNQISPQIPLQDSFWLKRTTTRITTFDSHGKLILGADTFNTVLREKRIEYHVNDLKTKSSFPFPPPQWVGGFSLANIPQYSYDTTKTYNWWINNDKFTVLEFTLSRTDSTNLIRFHKPLNVQISAGGPLTVCSGSSVALTAPAGFASYVWLRDGQFAGTGQTLNATQAGNYFVWVKTANNISTRSNTLTLTVSASPTVTSSAMTATTFCSGGSVMLMASGGTSYLWTPGGQTTSSITVTASGSYTVVGTNANGCTASAAPIVVTVNQTPATPTITLNGGATFCAGSSNTLSTNATGGTIEWQLNGNTVGSGQTFAPTQSGAYTVKVTNNGCSATSSPTTVNVLPSPGTPSVSASGPLTFCTGGSVTLSVAQTAGNQYVWTKDGANFGTTNSITATTAGTYVVTVTNSSGCTGTSAPQVVSVGNSLSPTITPSGSTNLCTGGSVTLDAGAGFASYIWTKDGVAFGTTQSVVANAAGSYVVAVTSSGGCSGSSAPTVVTLNQSPATPTISGSSSFCVGSMAMLDAPAGFATYVWSNNGSPAGTSSMLMTDQAGVYTVTVTNAGGCSATSAPFTLTANPLPTKPVISSSNGLTLCPGVCTTLDPGVIAATYFWSQGSTTSTIQICSAGSFTVSITDANGCVSISDPIVITSQANLTPVITPSGSLEFCAGSSVDLAADPGMATYVWKKDGTPINTNASTITVDAAGSYTVEVTNAGGCSGSSSPVVVVVNQGPAAPVINGDTAICSGESVTLSSSVTADNYRWFLDGNLFSSDPTVTVTAGGVYTLRLIGVNGCPSEPSANFTLVVESTPAKPIITRSGETLNASGSGTFQWYAGVAPIVGQTGASFTPTADGTYSVEVTSAGGCKATSDPFNFVASGVADAFQTLKLYPNPASDYLTLDFGRPVNELKLELFNAEGRLVLSQTERNLTNGQLRINLANLPSGVYSLSAATEAGVVWQKAVIE